MSDADTEGSGTTGQSGNTERQSSITSSESDGGPHIVVHTTNVANEEEEEDLPPSLLTPYLLNVSGIDSVTSTDIGSDYTSEGGDSGHDIEEEAITPTLRASLIKQVEDYLSDKGLANDLFLLKHVKRHRDGYVSLKLLSGYKKVKKLSRNWRVIAIALRGSTLLQVNEEGTKVRRRNPLPSSLLYDAPASRALVAVNVPTTHATMGGLATLFGAYGGVASLQVIRPKPGGGVPPELQSLLLRLPEVATTTSAIVEYEDVWGAVRALQEFVKPPTTLHVLRRGRQSERSPMLSSRNSPTPTPTPKGRPKFENGVSPDELRMRLRGSRSRQRNRFHESSASDGEETPNGNLSWRQGPPRHLTPQPSPRPHYRKPLGCMSTPNSPSTYRRAQKQQFGPLRSPRGPDGTRGFARVNS